MAVPAGCPSTINGNGAVFELGVTTGVFMFELQSIVGGCSGFSAWINSNVPNCTTGGAQFFTLKSSGGSPTCSIPFKVCKGTAPDFQFHGFNYFAPCTATNCACGGQPACVEAFGGGANDICAVPA